MATNRHAGLPREPLAINSKKVVHETLDGEVILIDLEKGDYYSLRGAGADVWAFLERGAEADAIASELGARYGGEAAPDEIRAAVHDVLGQLYDGGLIKPAGVEASAAIKPAPPLAAAYQPPVLERYTDMQEYLLVDPIHEVDERGWPARKAASG